MTITEASPEGAVARRFDVVIVGAGHAGAQAAMALRQRGFAGSIALVGDEAEPPYERPPLSKEYLSDDKSFERILIRPLSFWTERKITLFPGREVTQVDPARHRLVCRGGDLFEYGVMIWAAGGRPRRLTCGGSELDGVHGIRSRRDVDRLKAELKADGRVVIVGGGYIGLEVAAVLAKCRARVTLLEAMPRVLNRVACEALSAFYESEHRKHGVDLRTGVVVTCLVGEQRVNCVQLQDGSAIPADVVIVGIGIEPLVEPLLSAGARGGNGVAVDDLCRTSLPDIYAIGDCALHRNPFAALSEIRLESVQNANDMAATVAAAITGSSAPYHAVPWFWSNQYDLKLQTVGLSLGHDETALRGDPATRSFSVIYKRDGRVIALDCVNAVKDFVQGRKLVQAGANVASAILSNPAVPLKDHAAAA